LRNSRTLPGKISVGESVRQDRQPREPLGADDLCNERLEDRNLVDRAALLQRRNLLLDHRSPITDHTVADRPLRRATFERYINVLGLLPGIKVAANVPPPQNTDGATTLKLNVERKPFDISVGVNFNQPGVQGHQPGGPSGDSGWGAMFEVNRGLAPGFTYLRTFTPSIWFDMARVNLHAGTPSPSRLSSIAFGFRISNAKYYSLDLSVAKATGDVPVESASRSPRINATFSYPLN
jgi:hemolysin activation/secretion protein